jgi:hypothetical protein
MAEYYPLLAKAVASLPNSTQETRRAIYERARKALVAQLRSLQPPLPDADVARETQALDDAVARLETELGARNSAAAGALRSGSRFAAGRTAPNFDNSKAPALRPSSPARGANGAAPATVETPGELNAKEARRPAPDEMPAAPRDEPPQKPPSIRPDTVRPESMRPLAPHPQPDDVPQSRRLWIVFGVVMVVVAAVAAAAWKLRDRPEDFSAFNPVAQNQSEQTGAKIVKRIGGSASQSGATTAAPASPAAPAQTAASTQSAATSATSAPTDNSNVPVAYRAALLVAAPEEQTKIKTYVGTVIWQLENVSNDAGQPTTAVRADINVPEDKLKATVEIQKNGDPSLSASHTITIVFTVAADSPTGGIKQISVPQLRNEDSPNGDSLRGSSVPIMDNSFLIGLNRGDAEAANVALIKEREWFDIPILLANGRVAKLTFEKNASGDHAINEALASWQTQQ